MADPQSAGAVTLSLDIGSSKSQATTTRNTTSSVGSNVAAGNDLTVIAKGAGADSDITVTGSRLSAGNNALLKADGDILLQAARDTYEQHTQSKSTGASVGVGVTAGSNGVGFVATAGANASRGRSDGKDTTWTNTEVTAGNVLALQSGGDTSLIGATGRADQIIADVGRDLRIESLQDVSTYDSKQQGGGVQGSLCYGYCKSSVSGNVSQTRMKSDYKSVEEQSGLMAGDGGFVVDVKRNTTLTGGVISSSDQAVADGLNLLKTGTLVAEDVKNVASYKADRVSVSGGSGGAGTPVALGAFGESDSKTLSGISGGTVEIRDVAGQQALTGKTAAETIALLNRDTSDTLNSLNPIFDKEKIEAGFDIVEEMGKQAGQFLKNRARDADLAKARSEDPTLSESERLQATKEYYDLKSKWGTDGDYRRLSTAILAAISGNVTGGASELVQGAAVNYLQALGAAQIKELTKGLGGDGSAANAALHTILGCAGAAAQSASCAAGGVGALSSVVLNKLLDSARDDATKQLSAEERQSRLDLIGSIVAGITVAIDPSAVATVLTGAHIEAENNYLSEAQKAQRNEEIQACKSWACAVTAEVKWAAIDAGQDASFYTGVVAGVPAGMYDLARGLVQVAASPLETYAALKSLFESGDVLEKVPEAIKQSYIERITRMEEEYQRAGASGSFNSGVQGGKLLFDVAGLVTVATGVAKSGAILTEKVAAQVAKNAAKVDISAGVGLKGATGSVNNATAGIKWGEGIQGQGMPWENYLAAQMPASSRLPASFKTFDFYDEATKTAISAKTLDTTTAAKIANPRQVYSSLKGNIDSAANFTNYQLQSASLEAADIVSREVHVAVPKATTSAQWAEISRASKYAESQGVKLKVTVIE